MLRLGREIIRPSCSLRAGFQILSLAFPINLYLRSRGVATMCVHTHMVAIEIQTTENKIIIIIKINDKVEFLDRRSENLAIPQDVSRHRRLITLKYTKKKSSYAPTKTPSINMWRNNGHSWDIYLSLPIGWFHYAISKLTLNMAANKQSRHVKGSISSAQCLQ